MAGLRTEIVPEEIDVGADGLVLRRWRASDAGGLLTAIEQSQPELRRFMPWAHEPPTMASVLTFLERVVNTPQSTEAGFGLVEAAGSGPSSPPTGGQVVGGFGLHHRRGPGVLEIGYWVRSDRTGRGYATAATRALTAAALRYHPDVDRIEIRCDPANLASAAIPPKLGYRLDRVVESEIAAPAQTGRQQVWALSRADYLATERW